MVNKNLNHKLMLYILALVIFIDQASILMIVPFMPDLLNQLTHFDLETNSRIYGAMLASFALAQFIFAPIIGSISDYYGRRPVLIFCMLFFALDYLIMALASNVFWLFVGRILAGIPGASLSTAMSSVTDFTPAGEERVKNFGLLYGVMGFSLVLGPLIGGALSNYHLRVPFWFSLVICLICLVIIYFFLPETLSVEKRKKVKVKNPLQPLLKILRYPGMKFLLPSEILAFLAFQAPVVLMVFFCKERFNLTIFETTLLFSLYGVVFSSCQIFAVKMFVRRIGAMATCYLGISLQIIALIGIGISNNIYFTLFAFVFDAIGNISTPVIANFFTQQVKETEQGKLQGIIASCHSLSAVFGPLLFTAIFAWAIKNEAIFREGLPFLIAAILLFFSGVFLMFGIKKGKA